MKKLTVFLHAQIRHFQKSLYIVVALAIGLAIIGGCAEKKPTSPSQQIASPAVSVPLSQLKGLSLNGRDVAELAALASAPQALENADLSKAFGIHTEKYLGHVLNLIQDQSQSGSSLESVSIFFGKMPKKYAAQCSEDLSDGFCLIEPVSFNCDEALEQENWNDKTFSKLCQRLGRLKAYDPDYLVAVFDGDNTLWRQDVSNAGVKKGVDSKRIVWGDTKAELLSAWPPPEERTAYLKAKTPYDYYRELYNAVGPLWNYNYAALAFRGLTLNEMFKNFEESMQETYSPIPFPEMADLLKYLNAQGIVTGVVSASPIFGAIPMVETLQTGIPIDRIEGLDVFIKDAGKPGALPIRLGRLINQGKPGAKSGQVEKFKNYQEFLEYYGDWVLVDVDQVINARGGKGVQSRSIARRHVADQNRQTQKPEDRISLDDMRLVLIGGDNWAAPTDIIEPEGDRQKAAVELGNDQGLSEGLAFLASEGNIPGGTDILFIHRHVRDKKNKVTPKKGKLENFQAYLKQQRLIRPDTIGEVLTQTAITDVKMAGGQGGFVK